MDMGVNLDYPKGIPDTLAYAERGIAGGQWKHLPVKGNWFPDAFVGSMGALQSYVRRVGQRTANRIRIGL